MFFFVTSKLDKNILILANDQKKVEKKFLPSINLMLWQELNGVWYVLSYLPMPGLAAGTCFFNAAILSALKMLSWICANSMASM